MQKTRSYGLERSNLGACMQKSGHMVLKGVNWVQYAKQKIIFKVS